jgi:release factor glutamine methyltransferase
MAEDLATVAWNGQSVTITQAARKGARLLSESGIESAALDAEVLLSSVLGLKREQLYLNSHRHLTELERVRYSQSLQQRAEHKPVAYITGNKEFWSLDFLVTSDVLIPRPETELLVEVCLELAREARDQRSEVRGQSSEIAPPSSLVHAQCSLLHAPRALRVLEVGTGSGAVAVALAKELPNAEITATDISLAALEVARTNAARHGVSTRIKFLCGDLFDPLAGERDGFHLIVSNPPYIRTRELQKLPPDIRRWEPVIALDGGESGLNCYRRFAAEAARYLAVGGCALLEIGVNMAEEVSRLFTETDRYAAPAIYQDYARRNRLFVTKKLK